MLRKNFFVFVALSFFLLIFIISCDSHAQESAQGLTVSPPLNEITLKPGDVATETIRLTNPTQNLLELYPKAMNFESRGEGGDPSFYESDSSNHKFALANWISFEQPKIALASQQVVEFNYQLKVPADAEPGGHYGVVFFSSNPAEQPTNSSQVSIASMVGSLLLVKIPGDIKEVGSLEEFSADLFHSKTPVTLTTLIKNSGNIHFKPGGVIDIKNLWGGEVEKIPFNEARGNVLPDSERKFVEKWTPTVNHFWESPVGRFSANLKLSYGENQTPMESIITFWVIPRWAIVTAIALLVFIVLTLFIILMKRRSRSKRTMPPQNYQR